MGDGYRMINIANRDELKAYLVDKRMIRFEDNVNIHYFSGGVSGTVALISTIESEFIVKQALAKLNVSADWECDQTRLKVEHNALKVYADIVPENVPRPICFDDSNYIMIREAAPYNAVMWKSALLSGIFNNNVAIKAIDSLNLVHNKTAYNTTVMEEFKNSRFFYDLRIDPYINYTVLKHPQFSSQAKGVIDFLMSEHIALVHGDYSPKNILVNGDDIFILDFETAYFGHPAFDIAFFSNHFLLKSVKNKQWADQTLKMLSTMIKRYFCRVDFMDARVLEYRAVQTLGFLFLARIDGKSPAEYIQSDDDKKLIRETATQIINDDLNSFNDVLACLSEKIGSLKNTSLF